MCGFAGFVTLSGHSEPQAVLERMTAALVHRGPDEGGFYTDHSAAIGHRRLSIIDLATGQQPMCNEDGSVWVAYNGEIYNHARLGTELRQSGHRYKTRCDTESIVHAYEQFGRGCVDHFRGMFSFVIWDSVRRTLFGARDRLGIKPFYYYWDGRLFAFASEIKALLEHPAIRAELEDSLLPEYLAFGYVSEERTLFRHIRKLMPGHRLELEADSGELRVDRYWDIPEPQPIRPREDAAWIVECRERLEESVRLRLMSDVPLGVFLSGGIDSSLVAALVRRMTAAPVKTFSVGYREAPFSELHYARQVANVLGTQHQEVVLGRDEFFAALPRLIWHEDEPITWPSSISLYFVSRLAAKQAKVVLTGEGSDELFAGYERYRHYLFNRRWMRWYRRLPAPFRDLMRRQISGSRLLSAPLRRKLGHTFLGREDTLQSLQLDNFYGAFSREEQAELLLTSSDGDAYAGFFAAWNAAETRPLLSRMLYADQKTYLVELLMKQDQMSMAASIESRVPFLDHQFVEFAMQLPDRLKIRGGESKYILKRAAEGLLPREIIYRRKMGFPTPLRDWLRDPDATAIFDRLREADGLVAAYFDMEYLNTLIARHRAGLDDATDRIWRLLNLQIWGDLFLTGKQQVQPDAALMAMGTS